jgi:hypothetical protein
MDPALWWAPVTIIMVIIAVAVALNVAHYKCGRLQCLVIEDDLSPVSPRPSKEKSVNNV